METPNDVEDGVILNDTGRPVALRRRPDGRDVVYCGDWLYKDFSLFGSGCRCHPDDTDEPCESCARLLNGPKRPELLRKIFPALGGGGDGRARSVAALRVSGGSLGAAEAYLSDHGVVCVDPVRYALPPLQSHHGTQDSFFGAFFEEGDEQKDTDEFLTSQSGGDKAETNDEDREARRQAIREATDAPLPDEFLQLCKSCRCFPRLDYVEKGDQENIESKEAPEEIIVVARDHRMILMPGNIVPEKGEDTSKVVKKSSLSCVLCAGALHTKEAGSFRCQSCFLCEGCVQSGVVVNCPRLLNGGHLHTHPLTYDTACGRSCKVRLSDACQKDKACWACKECDDFAVCAACMQQPAPDGYNRLRGRVDGAAYSENASNAIDDTDEAEAHSTTERESSNENDDAEGSSNNDGGSGSFDEVAAERGAAVNWEGAYAEDVGGEVVVGTGGIEAAVPSVPQSNSVMNSRAAGLEVRRVEGRLPDYAEEALNRFLGHSENGSAKRTGVIAAADLVHVEGILHRAHAVDDRLTAQALCDAIGAGKLEIAGTLLLSRAFAPRAPPRAGPENNGDAHGSEEMMCWCGEEINEQTSPSGAVGCLGGHAMHASCAADLLLSGGSCPSCRQPLYFPKIPGPEAAAALDVAQKEAKRSQKQKEEKLLEAIEAMKAKGLKWSLSRGDCVRISSDLERCKRAQSGDPRVGGWNDEMEVCVGQEGIVTEIILAGDQEIAARVRRAFDHLYVPTPRKSYLCSRCRLWMPSPETGQRSCSVCNNCETCCQHFSLRFCPDKGEAWVWSSSLLQPFSLAKDIEKENVDKEAAAAKAAEQHLVRLRAELKAIQAAREAIRADSEQLKPPPMAGRELSVNSGSAIRDLLGTVSHADWERARHLMLLARQWGDNEAAKAIRAQLYSAIRQGELDTVARVVRRYNASRTAEEAKWADAVADTSEYIVQPTAQVDLRALPSMTAPRTGHSLNPESLFSSKHELLDENGNMWILVDDSEFPDPNKFVGAVCADDSATIKKEDLVGACVRRGVDWANYEQDGGAGSIGVISYVKKGYVGVRWGSRPQDFEYQAGNGVYELEFVGGPPPPPQGWLCVRPGGVGSPPVVMRSRSALRCFCCGDGLIPPRLGRERFSTVKGASIQPGDELVVAATLEHVIAEKCTERQVFCFFPTIDQSGKHEPPKGPPLQYWYRPEDLVFPRAQNTESEVDEDVVHYQGLMRTRRDLYLLLGGNELAARRTWEKCMREKMQNTGGLSTENEPNFASCARGHLLHARCLQGALLAGKCCPAPGCTEPLWVPQVRQKLSDDTCCGGSRNVLAEAEAEALRVANDLAGHAELVTTRAAERSSSEADDDLSRAGLVSLKMCPTCCAGPLFNENCSDMQAHHGECSLVSMRGRVDTSCTPEGTFRVSASEIANRLMEMSSTDSVADVLPRCPTHNVLVLFNGCMSCGHLFTDTSWNDMPQYDKKAMALLNVDKKKRKAAELLANQIRIEAAMLQFERDAVWDKVKGGNSSAYAERNGKDILKDLPPLPPPVQNYRVQQCGPECTRQHFGDGDCLVCGRDYNDHSGHNCWEGHRGRWIVAGNNHRP